ncbi:cobyric acid synthase [Hyphomicrobium sp.]|uniref:cobyric acid synthase n=1 Tax=Hyphomicrobium sp. TaxID=82 RepID=UPI003F6E548D
MARALMFAGTGSDVGKSLIVAGLCRVFRQRGLDVRPFKPQNMSNNAAVTADGGEIGRAQALQALAAGVRPTVHMNPVLLKPQSDTEAQVVVQGRVAGVAQAGRYHEAKRNLMAPVLDSFRHLAAGADLVLVEGAGAVSEINLRDNDIANLGFARAAGVPVILIGDIERGGVIASLVGTKTVLPIEDAAAICGFVVNKFRGDPRLFAEGMTAIERLTGWPSLGLVPYFRDASRLPAEDALALDARTGAGTQSGKPLVAVLAYPHISNFDDFDPLRLEEEIDLVFVRPGEVLPATARLAVLPGSKATIADLRVLRETGWDIDLAAHVRRGGHVLGICGGYQMLGTSVADPAGLEGPAQTVPGLGLLDVATTLCGTKTLRDVTGSAWGGGAPFTGYEMHVGETVGEGTRRPLLAIAGGRPDGAVAADGRIAGCYVHGLFAHDTQRAAWLEKIGARPSDLGYAADIEATLDRLADHLERHLDCAALLALARTIPG